MNFKIILIISCLFIQNSIIGQAITDINEINTDALQINGISVYFDQDVISPYNEDRNYTMGFGIAYTNPTIGEKWYLVSPLLRRQIDKLLGVEKLINNNHSQYTSTISLSGSAFTPLDIAIHTPILDDRPYGSIVALASERINVFNNEISLEDDSVEDDSLPSDDIEGSESTGNDINVEFESHPFAIKTSLSIGVLGLNAANKVQTYIHENHWMGSVRPIPNGWNNQIYQGGELTAMYDFQLITPFITRYNPNNGLKILESIFNIGAQIGYYNTFQVGIVSKFGGFDEGFWTNLNRTNNISMRAGEQRQSIIKWYIYTAIRSRFVFHNALLQGQFKESVHTFEHTEISPIIAEMEAGINLSILDKLNITFKPIVLRTAEFKGAGRNHLWGSFSLSYSN